MRIPAAKCFCHRNLPKQFPAYKFMSYKFHKIVVNYHSRTRPYITLITMRPRRRACGGGPHTCWAVRRRTRTHTQGHASDECRRGFAGHARSGTHAPTTPLVGPWKGTGVTALLVSVISSCTISKISVVCESSHRICVVRELGWANEYTSAFRPGQTKRQ